MTPLPVFVVPKECKSGIEPLWFHAVAEMYGFSMCKWREHNQFWESCIKVVSDRKITYNKDIKIHRIENVQYNDDFTVKSREIVYDTRRY